MPSHIKALEKIKRIEKKSLIGFQLRSSGFDHQQTSLSLVSICVSRRSRRFSVVIVRALRRRWYRTMATLGHCLELAHGSSPPCLVRSSRARSEAVAPKDAALRAKATQQWTWAAELCAPDHYGHLQQEGERVKAREQLLQPSGSLALNVNHILTRARLHCKLFCYFFLTHLSYIQISLYISKNTRKP